MTDNHGRTYSDTSSLTSLSSTGSDDTEGSSASKMSFDMKKKTMNIMKSKTPTEKLKSKALTHLANYKRLPNRASAYSPKVPLKTKVDPHAILSAMLEHAPTEKGTRYAAAAIIACHGELVDLGWLANTWLCYLMLPFMGNIDDRNPPSEAATPTMREETEAMVDALDGDRSDDMVRIRDGYQCILTDTYVNKTYMPHPLAQQGGVHVAHMLNRAVGAFKQRTPAGPYATWDIIKNYVGWSEARVAEVVAKMDTPLNGILLHTAFHGPWDNFSWTLKPVIENNQVVPHNYDVEILDHSNFQGDWAKNLRVTFRDRGNDEDVVKCTPKEEQRWLRRRNARPLPDPELIALHRAMCHILRMSGAAEAILLTFDGASAAGTPVPSSKARDADDLILLIQAFHLGIA